MAGLVSLQPVGNNFVAYYDDDSSVIFAPTGQDMYLPVGSSGDTGSSESDDPSTPTGDNGGDGGSADDDTDPTPNPPAPDPPDPPKPSPTPGVDLYNPWKNIPVSQTWEHHILTAGRGGTDYPLAYGTPIKAPADGTLHISGGVGDYAAGQIGSAGRRSILYLDKKFTRKQAKGSREAQGPMVAIVFQHQSQFGRAKHYNRGDIIGYTGASANGSDYGGDVHLHVHGLDRAGSRLDYRKFFTGAAG